MSAPVDVRAVLDEMIDCYGSTEECPDDTAFIAVARSARAALAKLIETDEEYDAALQEFGDLNRHIAEQGWVEVEFDALRKAGERFAAAKVRRNAALARCKGGA